MYTVVGIPPVGATAGLGDGDAVWIGVEVGDGEMVCVGVGVTTGAAEGAGPTYR